MGQSRRPAVAAGAFYDGCLRRVFRFSRPGVFRHDFKTDIQTDLLESFVAVVALATLLILTQSQARELGDPNQIYASGIASFLSALGISREFALNFALLAFATFVYDTLDVATRLGRYILQELTGLRSGAGSVLAAAATLALPVYFVTKKTVDASGAVVPVWKTFWTLFGSSNQLLAAMVLFAASVWLYKKKMKFRIVLIPAVFMTIVSLISMYFVLKPMIKSIAAGKQLTQAPLLFTTVTILLLMIMLIIEGARKFKK
jgi:carbon starvation protein